jgi:diguanylate cyclase (GGDEF)-like protein
MGDTMLDLFAKAVRKTMRANDIIGRIGGEEFIAILCEELPGASIAAERVRAAFEKAALAPDSPQIPATVSIGVVCGQPNVPIDLLIARADAMLYKAKGGGRNRVELDNHPVTVAAPQPAEGRSEVRAPAPAIHPAPALAVPILVR